MKNDQKLRKKTVTLNVERSSSEWKKNEYISQLPKIVWRFLSAIIIMRMVSNECEIIAYYEYGENKLFTW